MNNIWQSFVSDGAHPQEVEPVIIRSWQRSRDSLLDYQRVAKNQILPASSLRERRQEQEDLVSAGKPVLPYLFRYLEGLNHIVLLCDNDGFILDSLGDPSFMSKAQQVHLSPGANWREEVKGTNAIGTVLVEKIPLKVLGWEHYVQENHFLNCWAAPIKDMNGEVVGVLDISGEAFPNQKDDRLVEVVMMGARMIEQNLHLSELGRNFRFARHGIELAGEMLRDGFIAVDNHGVVTEINHTGARLLGRKREDLIGKLAVEVFGNKRWTFDGQALDIQMEEKNGWGITSRLRQVKDIDGFAMGAVGVLRPVSTQEREQLVWVGRSKITKSVFNRAERAAQTNANVLIQGESGTGKEIVARFIHQYSPRGEGPFVAINCAAIPATLIESELFGYADGAFTGARRGGQPGKFEIAQGGTIFLDEIGDMPHNVQASLLRVLQEREVVRIGDNRPRKIDVRVVAATNKNLTGRIEEGDFRLDLYYRLKVVTIELPPLRERLEDIYDLVPFFIKKICRSSDKYPVGVTEDVYNHLLTYDWPGNVRELENCIESMLAMTESSFLTADDLPEEIAVRNDRLSDDGENLMDRQMRQAIIKALSQTNGKIAPAARVLGIGRTTLYRKMEEYGLKH